MVVVANGCVGCCVITAAADDADDDDVVLIGVAVGNGENPIGFDGNVVFGTLCVYGVQQ